MSEQGHQEPQPTQEAELSLSYPSSPDEPPKEEAKSEEVVEPQAEPPEGDEPPVEKPAEKPAEGGEEEGEAVSTLPELIEAEQWDPEWLDNLKVPVKVDGETAETTFKELVASYQMNLAADKRLEEAKAKTKAATEAISQRETELSTQLGVLGQLIEAAEGALDTDSSAIDWADLKENDPARFSALKVEMQERKDGVEKIKNEAASKIRDAADQRLRELQENHEHILKSEHAALLEQIPEWQDPEKAKAGHAEIVSDLVERGFSREDAMGVSDHRLVLLARDAFMYRKTKAVADAPAKKVVKVPKVIKPGSKPASEPKSQPKDRAEILYG